MIEDERWPKPDFRPNDEPQFIFWLTFRNSGSTAIAQLLSTNPLVALLNKRGEGQWLVPGLCEDDRWDEAKPVDLDSVKAVWLNRYQQIKARRTHREIKYILEKSPPNIMRIRSLIGLFRKTIAVASVRDPYANISSCGFRYQRFDKIDEAARLDRLDQLTHDWVQANGKIRELVEDIGIRVVRYEEICVDPIASMSKLDLPEEIITNIDMTSELSIKDYPKQSMTDMNAKQRDLLTSREIEKIGTLLKPHHGLLSFFGYAIL